MKICVLTHGLMPFGRQYADLFTRRGHEVELFSLTPCQPLLGVPTRVFSTFQPKEGESRLHYLKCILPIRKALHQFKPDVVFAMYLTSAGVIACCSGHKRIVVSALGSDVNTHMDSPAWRTILRWVCRKSSLIHTVSGSLSEALQHHLGVHSSKILVSPVGVDTHFLTWTVPAARPHTGRIITTRSHAPVYDHPTLLKAMAVLKDRRIPFHTTFTHRQSEGTRQCARELGVDDCATFLPGYMNEELPALLGAHDVYVSCSRMDGTSQSLLEAMSTGLFPVVSDIPANTPWVDHGRTGYLFPVGNPVALADRLMEAFNQPTLLASAAQSNRERIQEHGDAEKEADRLLAGFQLCLAKDLKPV